MLQACWSPDVGQPHSGATSPTEPVHPKQMDPSPQEQPKATIDTNDKAHVPKLASLAATLVPPCCEPDGCTHTDDTVDVSDDDLPPPIYHQPFQQIYHLSADRVHNGVPLSDQEALQLVEHTNRVPPPSTLGLVQDIGSTDGRGFEETNSPAPLDPNLKCSKCAKYFKKGRIQKYKHHVETCGR